jgi:hypothetical protein
MSKPKDHIAPINCSDCLKRDVCTRLCESAKRYANQDYVYLREKLVSFPLPPNQIQERKLASKQESVDSRDVVVAILVSAGVPRRIIRRGLKTNQAKLNKIINKLKKRSQKNEE